MSRSQQRGGLSEQVADLRERSPSGYYIVTEEQRRERAKLAETVHNCEA